MRSGGRSGRRGHCRDPAFHRSRPLGAIGLAAPLGWACHLLIQRRGRGRRASSAGQEVEMTDSEWWDRREAAARSTIDRDSEARTALHAAQRRARDRAGEARRTADGRGVDPGGECTLASDARSSATNRAPHAILLIRCNCSKSWPGPACACSPIRTTARFRSRRRATRWSPRLTRETTRKAGVRRASAHTTR
jgi:hypothetical protein